VSASRDDGEPEPLEVIDLGPARPMRRPRGRWLSATSRWWILAVVVAASTVALGLAATQRGNTAKRRPVASRGDRGIPTTTVPTARSQQPTAALTTTSIARVTAVAQGCVVFSRGSADGGLQLLGSNRTPRRLTTDAGDWGPVWSPDGTKIVFNRYIGGNEYVYLIHADGSRLTQLTSSGSDAAPTWSADGSRILFTREVPGRSDFYTIKPDGTGLRRLTEGRAFDGGPVWSPDGTTIAFIGSGPANTSLYVMHADGSGRKRIGGAINVGWPRWSPNGHSIVFVNENDGSIQLINPDGRDPRKVFDVTTLHDAAVSNFTVPAWSPDGTKIIFAAGNSQTSHLYVVNFDGSGINQLTAGPVTDETPAWSSRPDCR
jgi:Tol biopolymer transport system component